MLARRHTPRARPGGPVAAATTAERVLVHECLAVASCLDASDSPTDCWCVGPAYDCDNDTLADDIDPCPGIAEGQPGSDATVKGGFEDLRCWLALETTLTGGSGFFGRVYNPAIQPVAVRRTRAEVPVTPATPTARPWPIRRGRTGIVVVGVAVDASIPGHPTAGIATAEEVRAAFRAGSIPPNAALAALQGFELNPIPILPQWAGRAIVPGYGFATAYARSIHDASLVSGSANFLDPLGSLVSVHVLEASSEVVVLGTHGSIRVPQGWVPLVPLPGKDAGFGTDWTLATPLVPVTTVVDTSCQAKANLDHLGEVAKTVPTPNYKKLGVFPVEDPRWNQGAALSSRPELPSYTAATTSTTSPDAVIRATPFGFRPVSSPVRGVLKNGYAAKPTLPNITILYGAANQFSLHGQVWRTKRHPIRSSPSPIPTSSARPTPIAIAPARPRGPG